MLSLCNKIIDGGLASSLELLGCGVDGDPLWSARLLHDNPEAIQQVHENFLSSGADIIITASYQASIDGFKKHLNLTEDESLKLMMKSVMIAQSAKIKFVQQRQDAEILIAGSVGPYGACQADGSEYHGNYMRQMDHNYITAWHRPRVNALIKAGVDLLAIETIPALSEAVCIIELLKEYPSTKYWITFSCKDEKHTNAGDEFKFAVKECHERAGSQLVGIGINCTSPKYVSSLLSEANGSIPDSEILPRIVYPNSGEEWIAGRGWKQNEENIHFYNLLIVWKNLGASAIGGCCRIGPEEIKKICDILKN